MADIVLIGASVRALAFSALRAGLTPHCADLFADWDLCQVATTERIELHRYPSAFFEVIRKHEGTPWAYTGGLENHPELLRRLMAHGPCLGCRPEAVAVVKDPFQLSQLCQRAGISFPECQAVPGSVPQDGSWLIKPIRSSGGLGVRRWYGGSAPADSYWQRFEHGAPQAAVFLAANSGCWLLGVTRQLVGEPVFHAPPFAYCGSIGPVNLSIAVTAELNRLGKLLRDAAGLRGIFGLDFVLEQDRVTLIEVNPRYPASAEVLERSAGFSAFALHADSFGIRDPIAAHREAMPTMPDLIVGRAIVFAAERRRFAQDSGIYQAPERFSDLPHPERWIEPGDPVLTTYAYGANLTECEQDLFDPSRVAVVTTP